MFDNKKTIKMSHVQIIALGFFLLIMLGTLLLMLPVSSNGPGGAGFIEALFTATSASCVTGLVVQDTCLYWSTFGQVVILCLIQIGGLGFMTIATMFYLMLRKRMRLRQREVLTESINMTQVGGIMRMAKKILYGTLLFEGVGALLMMFRFIPQFGISRGMWMSVFHSISSFCNAGFDLMGATYGPYSSFVPYQSDVYLNVIIMVLIIVGGIGFIVWDDVYKWKFRIKKYHLHSKMVLTFTLFLLIFGTVLIYIFEKDATGANLSQGDRILTAMFGAVTPRTAGFNTVDTAALSDSSKFLTMILMFIGGSPGSTAGGVKTTTIFVLILYALSYMRSTRGISVFGRSLERDSLRKASVVFFTNLILVLTGTLIICHFDRIPLTDVMFENFSAIGTVGMSTGITRRLATVSRCVVIFLMYCGRVGSLSFANALAGRRRVPQVQDVEEKITIG